MERRNVIISELNALTTFETQLSSQMADLASAMDHLLIEIPPNEDYFIHELNLQYKRYNKKRTKIRKQILYFLKQRDKYNQ